MFRNGGIDFYNGNQTDPRTFLSREVFNAATGIISPDTAISITFSDSAPQFTITPVGASYFTYYIQNQKLTSGTLSYTFGGSNPALTEGTWYFYLDANKTLNAFKVTDAESVDAIIRDYAVCGLGYWDSTDGTWMVRGWEGHSTQILPATHLYLHDVFGSKWEWGLELTNFTIADLIPTGDANSQFSYGAGEIHDEDISFNIDSSTAPAVFPVWYREGPTNWRFQAASNLPVIYDGSTRLRFNVLTGSTWSQQTVGQGNYVLCHIFATTDIVYPLVAIQGQAEYATLSAARSGADTELKSLYLEGLPTPEMVAIGTVIYQTNSTWTNATKRCKIVYVDSSNNTYVDWRQQDKLGGGSSGGGTSDHSLLSNLAYASSGHTGFVPDTIAVNVSSPLTGGGGLTQSITISLLPEYSIRERLTTTRTYYVRTDGNDANTGLVDNAGGAFLTIQNAINVYQSLDCNGRDVYLVVRAGTYTTGGQFTSRVGAGNVYIQGDSTTFSNVFINSSGNCLSASGHPAGSSINIDGFKLASSAGNAIQASRGSAVFFKNIEFGACAAGFHVYCLNSIISNNGNYLITGNAVVHQYCNGLAAISQQAVTVTISGTRAFTYFALSQNVSNLFNASCTWTVPGGSTITGQRYAVQGNAVLNTNGGGANYFPGTVAGSFSTGGQYL